MVIDKTIRDEAIVRQNNYSFLASLFLLEPQKEKIEEVQNLLIQLLDEDKEVIDVRDSDLVEEVIQDYYDLFYVPTSGSYVPPFESALRNYQADKKKPYGRLHSDDAIHVQLCYDAVGFDPWKLDIFEPLKEVKFPDHIGFELAFMSVLCANEDASKEDKDKTVQWQNLQYQFLSDHLSKWIENFAIAVSKNTDGFYKKCAEAAKNVILEDTDILAKKLNDERGE